MAKPKLLYYEILQYQESTLALLRKHFEIVSLASPKEDNEFILKQVDVAMAPLGFSFKKEKIDKFSQLKVIASSTLTVPHIDSETAEQRGIKVLSLGDEKELLASICCSVFSHASTVLPPM